MNNIKLLVFALLVLVVGVSIHFQKGPLFALLAPPNDFMTKIEGSHFPLQLNDPSGINYTLQRPPQRLISTTLATDHMLADLVTQQRIVAVSEYVDEPSLSTVVDVFDKKIIRTKGEIEAILSLQPDLVFVASYSNPEMVRYLLRSEVAVMRLSEFSTFEDILNNIRLVAAVTGTQQQAEVIIDDVNARLQFIQQQVAKRNVPRVLYYDLNGYSVGDRTLINAFIEIAGGANVAKGVLPDGEHKISEELAISLQPDIIIMNEWVFNQSPDNATQVTLLKNKKAWANVPAIVHNQLYTVPGALLRTVSHQSIKGAEKIASLLHPDIRTYEPETGNNDPIQTNKEVYHVR